jgi:hypothetical protein
MKKNDPPVTFDTVRRIALELPGVEEGTSYGTPALKGEKETDGAHVGRRRYDGA